MSDLTKCNQQNCDKPAAYFMTWPGRDQCGICEEHKSKAQGIADAMGFYLQFIPVLRLDEKPDAK